jgi:hypothetical protein
VARVRFLLRASVKPVVIGRGTMMLSGRSRGRAVQLAGMQ